jgi:BASS family bile acid:Na+ symporter
LNPAFTRTGAILIAIVLGALLPQAHVFIWLVRWLIMGQLFLVFLQTRMSRSSLRRSHFILLGVNIAMGFFAWQLGKWVGGKDVALAAFFGGITPTASAAPVIMSFLHGQVEYVVASFVLTNVVIAVLMPVLLPLVLGRPTPEAFAQVSGSVGLVVFAPMIAAQLLRLVWPGVTVWPPRLRNVSFGAWVMMMFLVTANASDFIRHQSDVAHHQVLQIAALTAFVSVLNFALGWFIGGKEFHREASQSLGQKNTVFTVYLALMYASPLVALGPTFYVIWHNIWNSWQLYRVDYRGPAAPALSAQRSD